MQPTALAADSMQLVAQVGTAETEAAQGWGHSGGAVMVAVEEVVVDSEMGGSEVVDVTSTVWVAELDSVQGVTGLAVTHEHMLPTAVMTLGASAWQPLTTHRMAVSWMAPELAHWQL